MGLREEKKAETRKSISDLATRLFIEKGYANVTVAEIAASAKVSVPTLFNYFPTKESMVFDEDDEREILLLAAVERRKEGVSILDALQTHFLQSSALDPVHMKGFEAFRKLIDSTPELSLHKRKTWQKHEQSLAVVIQKTSSEKLSKQEAGAIANFAIDAFLRALESKDPKASLKQLFSLLKRGFDG